MIIADADNAVGCILNSDQPPTKMFVYVTKARDDESRKTITLDFDGKLGRVCDPEYTIGQVKDVDKLIYDEKITEESLKGDDNLFKLAEEQAANVSSDIIEQEVVEDPFALTDDTIPQTKPEPKVETKPKAPKAKKDTVQEKAEPSSYADDFMSSIT